ncbi:hypothetical protein ACHQM5_004394 [Ranunculus cassubicifolius]
MDESWRMLIGSSTNLPRRKSTEETSSTHRNVFDHYRNSNSEILNPEDFRDVFGGPPKTILSRKTSVSDYNLYQDVFRSPESGFTIKKDRNLPVFGVKEQKQSISIIGEEQRRRGVYQRNDQGFYDDIFGSDDDNNRRSRSKKSNSSSVLSSEDFSPLRPSVAEDVFFSSFSSKLRPISIPLQRSSSTMAFEEQQTIQGKSDTQWPRPPLSDTHSLESKLTKPYKSSPFKSSRTQSATSPETIAIERASCPSIKPSIADTEIDSPSSVVSSLWNRETDENLKFQDALPEEDDEEIMSSYVIEISCEKRKVKKDESVIAIDEAIAWAKEKYQPQSFGAIGSGREQNVTPSTTKSFSERKGDIFFYENLH